MTLEEIESKIRTVQDFPKPGIQFKDIMPLLQDAESRKQILKILLSQAKAFNPEVIVGIESRGFFFGMLLADALDIPFIPIRKKGKLPGEVLSQTYELEYGTDQIEVQADALKQYQRIFIHDDVLATGGTCEAALKLCKHNDEVEMACSFLMDLTFLNGSNKIKPHTEHIYSVLTY